MSTPLEVVSLHLYPVKSCHGIDVQSAEIGPRGIRFDREWMWVDANSRFITQRQHPKLATIATSIDPDSLVLSASGQSPLHIPLKAVARGTREVEVWSDRAQACDEGDEAARWLKSALGLEARLVRMAESYERKVNPKYGIAAAHTGFADSLPFLLTSEESLSDLNLRLASPVPMNRFRPNIVVRGAPAYAEDSWRHLRLGSLEFDVSRDCTRCAIITIDQSSGQSGPEPLRTLSTYRREGTKIRFGRNMIHLTTGQLRIGDKGTPH